MKKTGTKEKKSNMSAQKNGSFLFLFVFIALHVLLITHNAFAATATYVATSASAKAYEGATQATGAFNGAEAEFTAGEYTSASVDDSNYVQDDETTGLSTKYQYHRFMFVIAEDPATVTQIQVTWKGFGGNKGGGIQSFTGETEVETADGPVSFEKLHDTFVSDPSTLPKITYARNSVRKTGRIRAVKRFSYTGPLTVLALSNGKNIKLTPYHEVLIDPMTDEYLRADQLTVEAKLVSLSGEEISVSGITTEEFNGYVYDLTVEEFHNFLLTAGVFVHNSQDLGNFGHSLWVSESSAYKSGGWTGSWTGNTSGTSTTKETLSVTFTSNLTNIIEGTKVNFGVYSNWPKPSGATNVSAINTYYAEVIITYTPPVPPNAPSSLGPTSYVDASTVTDTSPTLQFTQSDPNAGNTLKFQIQIDDTSDFSSPVVDYTSALIAQGATNFTVGQAAGSGTYAVGGANIDLNNGSYYWRVRSNNNVQWGNWATANSGAVAFVLNNTTFSTVTSTADTRTLGTLRFALLNIAAGGTITFDNTVFPSGTPATISPTSALPALTTGITIDATSRGVIIDGTNAGAGVDGFTLSTAINSSLKNLQIKSFTDDGVSVSANGSTVQNCQIYSNTDDGIEITGTSTSSTIQSNTIYSNGGDGIYYTSTGGTSSIKGNYIGTNSAWSTTIGNTGDGIEINQSAGWVTIGGTGAGDGNWLCKNFIGIRILNGSVSIYGNYVGTNSSGATNLGNSTIGIYAESGADAITIGSSSSADKNVIASSGANGIDMQNTGSTSTIVANYIGTDSSWRDLANGANNTGAGGIGIFGSGGTFVIGGTLASDRNFIGFHNNTATDYGIYVSNGTVTIKGNYIGTNTAGTPANLGNSLGINLALAGGTTTVGSTTNGEQNVIGYNTNGINITASGATIIGNFIGMNSSYASAANVNYGIYVNAAAITPTIGGTAAGSANFIGFHAGAGGAGIFVNDGSPTIKGNYIGTNAAGTNLGNTNGIALAAGADAVTIGGTASGAGNVISLNAADGINNLSTNASIVVQGNFIGTDSAGTASWPNGGDGIETQAGTITIGNAGEAQRNVIGPNTGLGINLPSGVSITLSFAGTVEINDDVTFAKGTLNLGSAIINISGNWTNGSFATLNASSSTVIFDGSSSQTITTSAKDFNNVTLNNTGSGGSDLITAVGNLDINGTLTLTNGVLTLTDASNPNVILAGNLTINNSADPGITRGSGTWTFDGTSLSGSVITDSTSGIDLGNLTLNKTASFAGDDFNLTMLGSNVKATSITIDGTAGTYDTLDLVAYTLTLTGNGTPLSLSGSAVFNGSSGTLKYEPAATTGVNVAAATYNNVEFNKASNSFMLQGLLDVNGNLTITAGTLDVDSNGDTAGGTVYNITVGGNWTNLGTFTRRSGTVTFDGFTSPVTLNSGGSVFNNLTINKTTAAKEVDVITNNLSVFNVFNITTGTLDMSGTSLNITASGDTTIGANGRFSKGTGTFAFDTTSTEVYTDNSSNGPQNLGTVTI